METVAEWIARQRREDDERARRRAVLGIRTRRPAIFIARATTPYPCAVCGVKVRRGQLATWKFRRDLPKRLMHAQCLLVDP